MSLEYYNIEMFITTLLHLVPRNSESGTATTKFRILVLNMSTANAFVECSGYKCLWTFQHVLWTELNSWTKCETL